MTDSGFSAVDDVLNGTPLHSDLGFKSTSKRASIQIKIKEESSNKKPRDRALADFVVKTTVNWNSVEQCPLFRKYCPSSFLALEFTNKCTGDIIKKVLNGTILVKDCVNHTISFVAFGYSATQLRDRKYVFYDKSLGKWETLTRQFGNFDAIKTVSKKAARIGLLFSSSTEVARLKDEDIGSPVEDVTKGDYNFSDGCGYISLSMAQKVMKSLNVQSRYVHQHPPMASVYQVRVQGSKGVLMLDPSLNRGIRLRKSMIKFEWTLVGPHILGVTNDPGLSRPYKVASLNLQFTRLLSALGVSDRVFLDKTRAYLQDVASLDQFPGPVEVKIRFLCANEYFDEAEELMRSQPDVGNSVKETLKKIKKKIILAWEKKLPQGFSKPLELRSQLKLKIPIQDSRNVYGVCDPSEQLDYGECFFQPTVQGKPMVLDGVQVVVSKNPCYHPGDVRVLRCRNIRALHHLYDCVVFPVKGERPHSNEIAGSDLDGDEYFVCWDKDLIPTTVAPPAIYKGSSEKKFNFVSEKQLKDSFATYRNKMATVNDLYELWANQKGAGCPECSLLADFFSTAVDSAKTGETVEIPEFLLAIRERPLPPKRFVWETMLGIIDNFRTQQITDTFAKTSAETTASVFDFDEMENLLKDRGISVTEFMRFRLLLAWLKQHKDIGEDKVLHLLKIIDFSHFEPQQRMNALADLHPYGQKAGQLLVNSLYRSEVLWDEDIRSVQGSDNTLSWVFEDRMTQQDFTWSKVNDMMTKKAVKMLVFQISNHGTKWVLVLTVADALELQDSVHPFESATGRTSSSAYMSVHGVSLDSKVSPLQNRYMISLDGSRIQIYNSQAFRRTDTFICLWDLEDNQLGMSVALNKFDQSFSKNHNNARVYRQDVEKVELFCKHKKPYQTQRFSLFEKQEDNANMEDEDEKKVTKHKALDFSFREEEFPALSQGELTEYPHCKLLEFVTEFERLQNKVLEALHSGDDIATTFEELENCLHKPELCCEAALCIEYLVFLPAFHHKLRVSQCFNIISALLSISEPGLPRIERFGESMCRLGVELTTLDLIDFLTFLMYTLPATERVMARFLTGILNSATWRGLMTLDAAGSQYFLHWACLLSVEQYHHMMEAAHQAMDAARIMQGTIFISPEGDNNVIILHMEGDHSLVQTDGIAASLITEDSEVPYKPMFYFAIAKVLNTSTFRVKLMWPADEAILASELKDNIAENGIRWRVDVLPNLVTYSRMIAALEKTCKGYRKNPILSEIVESLPGQNRHGGGCQSDQQKLDGQVKQNLDGQSESVLVYDIKQLDDIQLTRDSQEVGGQANHDSKTEGKIHDEPKEEDDKQLSENLQLEDGQINKSVEPVLNQVDPNSKDTYFMTENDEKQNKDGANCMYDDISVSGKDKFKKGNQKEVENTSASSMLSAAERTQSNLQSVRNLNDSQELAVKASLGETLTLIQGPPGTGKTVMAARIIQQWLQHFSETKVLACAETNEGINNIIKALLKVGISGDDILRVGSNVADDLREYSLEDQLRGHEKRDKYRYNEMKLKAAIISKAKIICCTCIGSGSTELKDLDFQNILIDEAGQALEPACLVSLRPGVKRLCLIGDEKQLPPLVISPLATDLKQNLFCRLSTQTHKVHLLNTQYRMHPQISHFPNDTFYDGKLVDAEICRVKTPPEAFKTLFPKNTEGRSVVFVDVQYCGKEHREDTQCGECRVGPNLSNPKEVVTVSRLVRSLLDNGVKPSDIAVISPYRKQVEDLSRQLGSLQVHVKTIDGFQGQEREIIIFSTVRSNVHPQSTSSGHLGHLKDPHRMNVALTRAQRGLIVLGHKDTLKSDPNWNSWLQFVERCGFVTQEICQTISRKFPTQGRGRGQGRGSRRK